MDPLSQAAVGAAAAQAVAGRKRVLFAIVLGVISGMAADLDILLKSSVDPLMSLEYHRHFSHSLIFVPLGGFLVACLAYPIFKHFFSVSS